MLTNISQNNSYCIPLGLQFHSLEESNNQNYYSTKDLSDQNTNQGFYTKSPIQQIQFPVQEKSLSFVIGERVIGPLIDSSQSVISRIVKLAKSIDKSLSFPVASALAIERESDEIIEGIRQILIKNFASSCTQSHNIIADKYEPSKNLDELIKEIRKANLVYEVGQYLIKKGQHKLIEKLFTKEEQDLIYGRGFKKFNMGPPQVPQVGALNIDLG